MNLLQKEVEESQEQLFHGGERTDHCLQEPWTAFWPMYCLKEVCGMIASKRKAE